MTSKSSRQYILFRMGIATRVWLAFILIIVMFITMGIIGIQSLKSLSDLTHKMYRHPFTVSNAVRDIQYRITAMHRDMKDIAFASSTTQVKQIAVQLDEHEQLVLTTFDLIQQRFLGKLSQVKKARDNFVNWRILRQQMIDERLKQQNHKVSKTIIKRHDKHVQGMEQSIASLLKYANNKAEIFLQHTVQERDSTIELFWILLVSLSFLVVLTGIMIIHAIVRPIIRMSKSLKQLALGDLTGEITDRNRDDEIGAIANAMTELQQSNKLLSEKAIKIAKGDLSVDIEIRSEHDFLASSLAEMLKQQRQASYISDGINQLYEVMRGNLGVMELSDNIIRFLCQYTQSDLGCFFLNQTGWIHRVSSYAILSDLLPEGVFKVGEGLVGEAAVQKKAMFITELPANYMTLCSASGETLIRTVAIFPIIWNEEVVAILELGRMEDLSPDHLSFIEAVNIPVAVALNTAVIHAEEKFMIVTNEINDD